MHYWMVFILFWKIGKKLKVFLIGNNSLLNIRCFSLCSLFLFRTESLYFVLSITTAEDFCNGKITHNCITTYIYCCFYLFTHSTSYCWALLCSLWLVRNKMSWYSFCLWGTHSCKDIIYIKLYFFTLLYTVYEGNIESILNVHIGECLNG